jgi:hypothetical protein
MKLFIFHPQREFGNITVKQYGKFADFTGKERQILPENIAFELMGKHASFTAPSIRSNK